MATPIKRIEKDFLLKILYDYRIPVIYLRNQTQYCFTMEKPAKDQLFFKSDRLVEGLKPRKKIGLIFNYQGQVITFSVEVFSVKDQSIVTNEPEFLYKNLERSFSRVASLPEIEVQFTFSGDRYSLSYPRTDSYENPDDTDVPNSIDLRNLNALIQQMAVWVKGCASGYKMVIFKDVKPSTMEERLLAETGKALFIPSTEFENLSDDAGPQNRLITRSVFKRYLESTGTDPQYLDVVCARFIKQKLDAGILSDLWVPILFQEYVIGYVRIWINTSGKQPFDNYVIDSLYHFAKIITSSLVANGYFDSGKMKKEPFAGKIIDISASGLLFTYPHSPLASSLFPENELEMQLTSPHRRVNCKARIVRRYKDSSHGYFGCSFSDIAAEDIRFLFEYLYGKTLTDSDSGFLSGQV
ncbi:MAG: PilZ domain-containing protein [Treponema sp.]|nr:PilZ domain-containing protein [Treponema sp.]